MLVHYDYQDDFMTTSGRPKDDTVLNSDYRHITPF